MTQYDDPALNSAEQDSGMTTKELEMNVDLNSTEYQGQDQSPSKKTSLFGRLKDKTKNKVSQLKNKVGKKKSGGTPSESPSESTEQDEGVADEDDAEEEDMSKDLPASVEDAPLAPTTPSNTESETAPASTEFGSGVQEGQTESPPQSTQPEPEPETDTPQQMQDSNGATQGEDQSYTDKAAEGAQGLKDTAYGTVAAAAAAVGYNKLYGSGGKPEESSIPNNENTSGPQEKAQEFGQQASETATDAANTVTESAYQAKDVVAGKAKELNNATGDSQTYTQKASDKADELNNATGDSQTYTQEASDKVDELNNVTGDSQTYTQKASEKADELNNATGDSQTYTEKAAEAAAAVTGGVAATLGLDKNSNASDGTSLADKTRDYLDSAVGNTTAYTQAAIDKTKEVAGVGNGTTENTTRSVADTTKPNAGPVADTAKDRIASATGAVQDTAGSTYESSKGSVQTATDSAKNYGQQAVDGTKGYMQSVTDMSKDYASKTADQAAAVRNAAVDAVTPKDEHKALSDNVTATITNLPVQIKDSVTSAMQGTNATAASSAHDDPPKDGGFLGRFTDLIFGKKLPEHSEAATTNTTGGETTGVDGSPASEGNSVQQ